MASNSEFYIFRDSRKRVPGGDLVAALRAELRGLPTRPTPDNLNSLLLHAGELECALCDAAVPPAIRQHACGLTDLLAETALLCDRPNADCDGRKVAAAASQIFERISCSQSVNLGVPEGFAYYAIHPLDYADVITRLRLQAQSALVVGVRSIGTTLSAVVAAKLRQSRVPAVRITVRPTGNPYERECEFDLPQQHSIGASSAANAEFLICDEGPGRSGSSFLSLAEALERAGVPRSRIHILCSYEPDAGALCAHDGERRWNRYRSTPAGMTRRLPPDAAEPIDASELRRRRLPDRESWPGVWQLFEPLTYASADQRALLTFEGHAHYGAAVAVRNRALSDAGLGPEYFGQEAGFGRQLAAQGRALRQEDLNSRLLTHMAEYCAWRAREFRVQEIRESDLETMARVNFHRGFEVALEDFSLPVERPAICDSRMMPHAWLQTEDGRWLKLDAAIHGDDHFFPGPCDIAWDLAGIVVEWQLDDAARDFLLDCYRRAGGDHAASRTKAYELAYATFRMAWSRMAAASVGEAEEKSRLMRDHRRYREFLLRTQPWRFAEHYAQPQSNRAAVAMNVAPHGSPA